MLDKALWLERPGSITGEIPSAPARRGALGPHKQNPHTLHTAGFVVGILGLTAAPGEGLPNQCAGSVVSLGHTDQPASGVAGWPPRVPSSLQAARSGVRGPSAYSHVVSVAHSLCVRECEESWGALSFYSRTKLFFQKPRSHNS